MPRKTLQPASLFPSGRWGFSQVALAPPASTIVTIAGQVAADAEGNTIGSTKSDQMHAVLDNVFHALQAAGGGPDDILHLQIHVVDFVPGKDADELAQVLVTRFGTDNPPASTWIGVTGLAQPDYRVEIQTIAAIDTRQ